MGKMKELHFSDVLLLPRKAQIDTRLAADTSIQFGPKRFKLPIMPANMKTVINEDLARWLAEHKYFYVMHRFNVDTVKFARSMMGSGCTSVSIGVNDDSLRIVQGLAEWAPPDYITIDIAHGHCDKMARMVDYVKKHLPEAFIIAGNVCTRSGIDFLSELGVNAVKVGIGSGKVCTTKLMTGFSRPQFSALLEAQGINERACMQRCHVFSCEDDRERCGCGNSLIGTVHKRVAIISDGGAEHNGDIAKALVAGADMVMCGGMLAGFDESPGKKVVHDDGRITKEYFGSASEHNKGAKEFIEGRRIEIPYRGSIVDKLQEIEQSLRSSISYAGGTTLQALRDVEWVIQ